MWIRWCCFCCLRPIYHLFLFGCCLITVCWLVFSALQNSLCSLANKIPFRRRSPALIHQLKLSRTTNQKNQDKHENGFWALPVVQLMVDGDAARGQRRRGKKMGKLTLSLTLSRGVKKNIVLSGTSNQNLFVWHQEQTWGKTIGQKKQSSNCVNYFCCGFLKVDLKMSGATQEQMYLPRSPYEPSSPQSPSPVSRIRSPSGLGESQQLRMPMFQGSPPSSARGGSPLALPPPPPPMAPFDPIRLVWLISQPF